MLLPVAANKTIATTHAVVAHTIALFLPGWFITLDKKTVARAVIAAGMVTSIRIKIKGAANQNRIPKRPNPPSTPTPPPDKMWKPPDPSGGKRSPLGGT